ncbi:MAG: ABC transporter ATP-binding protein [Myxococcota bacterium]
MTEKNGKLLEVADLVKRYRKLVAVDGTRFDIQPGEFVGLIGPNGAGKSTTMGCIAGVLALDEGSISVAGVDVSSEPVESRKQIGFVPQDLELYDYLTGEEFLRFVGAVRDVDEAELDDQINHLLEITELEDAKDRVIKEYSGGMARKIAICSALVGPPPLLLLDESFVGLDPESTWRIRRELSDYCEDGGAILISSHILDMVERMCSRVLIMVEGVIERDISSDDMHSMFDAGEYDDLTSIYLDATGKRVAG